MKALTRFFVFSICITLILTACNANNNKYQENANLPQLKEEWELEYEAWKALDIRDYQFIYNDEIGSSGKITVKNGTACESEGFHMPGNVFLTIDDLFMTIDRGFKSDSENHHPEQIRTSFSVRYDPVYHFPEHYSITHVMSTPGWGGNGWSFDAFKFSRLEDLEEEKWQPNENMPELTAEWEREYEAWQSLNIQNYQFNHQKCYNSDSFVYWDYRSKITVKNGQFQESVGISPDGFLGDSVTIFNIFNDINAKFMEEKYPGWNYWPAIGMYFTVEYDPQYHFPTYFEYGHIIDMTPSQPVYNRLAYSIRVSDFTPTK